MKKLMSFIKKISLGQILSMLLVSLLVISSTACSNTGTYARTSDQPRTNFGKTSDQIRPEIPQGATTSKYQGGMNDYSDVDPRMDTSRPETKAKTLGERAERNITQKSVDSPEQFAKNYRQGTPLNERVQKLAEDVKSSVQETQEGLSKGTQRGLENLKSNTQNAAEDISSQTQQTAQDASNALGKTSERVGRNVSQAARNTADYVQ